MQCADQGALVAGSLTPRLQRVLKAELRRKRLEMDNPLNLKIPKFWNLTAEIQAQQRKQMEGGQIPRGLR